jgi:thiamine-monophosphate kinase
MEGVHFTLPPAEPRLIGRKALAVNLSDIAAMAGTPLAATVSVALPSSRGNAFAREVHAGLEELASAFGVSIAGGDTNIWDGPFVISITLIGEPGEQGPITRSGAQPGDWLMTTGHFGGSIHGHHLTFLPRVNEARKLCEAVSLHAMIDVSDGLAADLHHILEESKAGALLYEGAIPISEAALEAASGKPSLEHALSDGEDFELLFAVASEDGRALLANPPFEAMLSHIGEVVSGPGCQIVDSRGNRRELPAAGWQHRFEG